MSLEISSNATKLILIEMRWFIWRDHAPSVKILLQYHGLFLLLDLNITSYFQKLDSKDTEINTTIVYTCRSFTE